LVATYFDVFQPNCVTHDLTWQGTTFFPVRLNYNPCDPDPCEDGECGRTEDRLRSKCNCNPGFAVFL